MIREMNKSLVKDLINEINLMATEEMKIMEVCGTHTQMISKIGLRSLLSPKVKLISGPGCPVCVTDQSYIDGAIEITDKYDVVMTTFGDLMRVRGAERSLLEEKGKGKDVRVIYSPLDLIEMAEKNKEKKVIFLGVGFETTAPIIALTIKTAAEKRIENLFFLTSIKLMAPILHYILKQPSNSIRGLICPGHVAAVKGSDYFQFVGVDYIIPSAVCGFEALDILGGIHYLVKQITQKKKSAFENLYKRCVRPQGNPRACQLLDEVFNVSQGEWRGIGRIENSSLTINEKYSNFDANEIFTIENKPIKVIVNCECKDILLGNKTPRECRYFDKLCNPMKPYGPCMVSTEGACAIAYRYREEI